MKTFAILLLKKIGTQILLSLATETVKVLKDRPDNPINEQDAARIEAVKTLVKAAK